MARKDLSNSAEVLLSVIFANSGSTLTMGNEKHRLTDQARDAMSELIFEGYVKAEKADAARAASMTYTLTEKGAKLDRQKSFEWIEKNSFFLTTSINQE